MGWLFAAYAVVWIVLFLYLVNVNKKQNAIGEELAALSRKLSEKRPG